MSPAAAGGLSSNPTSTRYPGVTDSAMRALPPEGRRRWRRLDTADLLPVRPLVVGAGELAMNRREVVAVHLDAHLDPHVVAAVEIPGARGTDDVAVRRPDEE